MYLEIMTKGIMVMSTVDRVISGHTYGGQFIPINHVGELTGENARI